MNSVRKKAQITFQCPIDLIEQVECEAGGLGITFSELLRQIVSDYFDEPGETDLADGDDADEYIYQPPFDL